MTKAKTSLRSGLSQPRHVIQALHTIINEHNAECSHIYEYIQLKKKHGTRAVPKPILSGPVISELHQKIYATSDKTQSVFLSLLCLQEFASNHDVLDPWSKFHKEITELMYECLSHCLDTKKRESSSNWRKGLTKFCNVLTCVADKSDSLSAGLFTRCSEELLTVFLSKDVDADIQSVILYGLSVICQHALAPSIAEAISDLALYIKYLAKMILNLSVEAQTSAYTILHKYLYCTQRPVAQEAPIWFAKWPAICQVFIQSYSKSFSEGCGMFLEEICEVQKLQKSSKDRTMKPSLSEFRSAAQTKNAILNISTVQRKSRKDNSSSSCLEGRSSSVRSSIKADKFQEPIAIATAKDVKPFVAIAAANKRVSEPKLFSNNMYQTPYYRDSRKSLSLCQKEKKSVSSSDQIQSKLGAKQEHVELATFFQDKEESTVSRNVKAKQKILDKENLKVHHKPVNKKTMNYPMKGKVSSEHNAVKFKGRSQRVDVLSQNPLSTLNEEDSCSRVEKWLRESSIETSSVDKFYTDTDKSECNDDVQIIKTELKSCKSNQKTEDANRKRSSSAIAAESKRLKKDSPYVPLCSEGSKITNAQNRQEQGVHENEGKQMDLPKFKGKQMGKEPYSKLNKDEANDVSCVENANPFLTHLFKDYHAEPKCPVNRWEEKLRMLEQQRNFEKSQQNDVYSFLASGLSATDNFKKPRAPAKKKTAPQQSTKQSKFIKTGPLKIERTLRSEFKENIPPVASLKETVTKANQLHSFGSLRNIDSKPGEKKKGQAMCKSPQGCKPMVYTVPSSYSHKNIKKTTCAPESYVGKNPSVSDQKCYSPLLDDSTEVTRSQKAPETKPVNCAPVSGKGKAHVEKSEKTSNLIDPVSPTNAYDVFNKGARCIADGKTAGDISASGNVKVSSNVSSCLNQSSLKNYYSPNISCVRDVDSGVEVTSNEDASRNRSKKKVSTSSPFLRMRVREFLEQATGANAAVVSNNDVLTAEMIQIKGLVEKLDKSVTLCQTVTLDNQQKLSDGKTALQGCSNYLGPYEDQSFNATVEASVYRDFNAFRRDLKARHTARVLKTVKEVLENNYSLGSSSDSD